MNTLAHIPPMMASASLDSLMDIFLGLTPDAGIGIMLLIWAAIVAFMLIVRFFKG